MVLDPSHKNWVLGGLFRDIKAINSGRFTEKMMYLPAPTSLKNLILWWKQRQLIKNDKYLLFSSTTPLINYLRFRGKKRPNQIIGLWYTHKEGDFTYDDCKALQSADIIFLHSNRDACRIKRESNARLSVIIGGIRRTSFNLEASRGPKIVWVGTPAPRKQPELFLEIVRLAPSLSFRLLGYGWRNSNFWESVSTLENLEYIEVTGPLSSHDFDGCNIYLSTSKIEGGPMPLLESLAAGLLPVVTDTGFVADVLNVAEIPQNFIVNSYRAMDFVRTIEVALDLARSGFTVNREKVLNLDLERLSSKIYNEMRTHIDT